MTDDIALLHGSWSDGNTEVQNRRGEWAAGQLRAAGEPASG